MEISPRELKPQEWMSLSTGAQRSKCHGLMPKPWEDWQRGTLPIGLRRSHQRWKQNKERLDIRSWRKKAEGRGVVHQGQYHKKVKKISTSWENQNTHTHPAQGCKVEYGNCHKRGQSIAEGQRPDSMTISACILTFTTLSPCHQSLLKSLFSRVPCYHSLPPLPWLLVPPFLLFFSHSSLSH